jgi:hypothetical protein
MIYFKPEMKSKLEFEGLEPGIIPITPSLIKLAIKINGKTKKIDRCQLAIIPAYTFTNFKSQSQSIDCILVDIAKPPFGKLSPFSIHVALSRSRGRNNI